MRIGNYHIETYKSNGWYLDFEHKYWYLWNIYAGPFCIEICRTDWNKCYKESCQNYTSKCKHCMDCNVCKYCYLNKEIYK